MPRSRNDLPDWVPGVLARLRHRRFFSLEDLNVAIAELVVELNQRAFRRLDSSRRSAFEAIDRPALKALPTKRFEPFQWRKARVNIDYHVAFDDRDYSVPHALIGERVEVRATAMTVEIFTAVSESSFSALFEGIRQEPSPSRLLKKPFRCDPRNEKNSFF